MAAYDITTAGASKLFDTDVGSYNASVAIDSNHVINFWSGVASDGFTQVFTINTTTWAITTASSQLEFDTNNGQSKSVCKVDANHVLAVWEGPGVSQIFTVNTSTWAVTTANNTFIIDTLVFWRTSVFMIDTNHAIVAWDGGAAGTTPKVQTLTVNTTTWAITTANSPLTFYGAESNYHSFKKIDDTHFIGFFTDQASGDGFVQVFAVNTTTWAITTASTVLEFDTVNATYNCCHQIDSNHFINFWAGNALDGFAQTFTINTTTWAVTTASAQLEYDTTNGTDNSCSQIDSNHFIDFWSGATNDGFTQTFTVNTTTWEVTTNGTALEYDTQNNLWNSCCVIDSNHVVNFWLGGATTTDGFSQVFTIEAGALGPANLKSYNTNLKANIKSIDGNLITNMKSLDTNV